MTLSHEPLSESSPVPAQPSPAGSASAELRNWFGAVILELLPELTGTAVRFTRNPTEAEDLVAETVTRAWQGLRTLEDRSRFRGWIFRILTNTWISDCRARRVRPPEEPLPEGEECFSIFERLHQPFLLWGGNPEHLFLNDLLREDLEAAIEALPESFRTVVVFADVHGFSYGEIAKIVGIPIGTVRSRLARGRSRLQEALWIHAHERGWVDLPETEPGSGGSHE